MKIFDHPNTKYFKCPVCMTANDKPVVFIPIDGTQENNTIQTLQVHVDCIRPMLVQGNNNSTWMTQFIDTKWSEVYLDNPRRSKV